MQTRIIAGFPGVGKTTFCKSNRSALDSDSSKFSWTVINGEKVRNPDFPKNYIDHMKHNIGKYEFIFVSSHKEVRDALKAECLFFYLVYPDSRSKELYLKRYMDRGSPEEFVELLDKNWEEWIWQCGLEKRSSLHELNYGLYLDSAIDHIVRSEDEEPVFDSWFWFSCGTQEEAGE